MFYFVYVLFSLKDRKFYIGFTSNIERRFNEHITGNNRSTKNKLPLELLYYEAFLNKEDAKSRELFLKSGSGHKFIKKQLTNYFKTKS